MKFIHIDNPAGTDGRFNVGDDIQVQAAKRFIPEFDCYIEKKMLQTYCGSSAGTILNGWFMHDPNDWPPSQNLHPLIVSFHMNPKPAKVMLERGRGFFESYAPIGCRDYQTVEAFQRAGIEAYYSGCLTLTLRREDYLAESLQERRGIFAVDVLYKLRNAGGRLSRLSRAIGLRSAEEKFRQKVEGRILDRLIDCADKGAVKQIYHSQKATSDSPSMRHEVARNVLSMYANAKLVLTSRIHCALPCLAFGTPVIFVDGALNDTSERARLHGIIDLMPVLKVDEEGNCDFEGLERALDSKSSEERIARISKIQDGLIKSCQDYYSNSTQKDMERI